MKSLSKEKKQEIATRLNAAIHESPLLSALQYRVRSLRGRFYYEQRDPETDDYSIVARLTPLVKPQYRYLLEIEHRKGSWSEVLQGTLDAVSTRIINDDQGTFHGLGHLDASIREANQSHCDRVTLEQREPLHFYERESGRLCEVSEVLFHAFNVPIPIIAEPSMWYIYHRTPSLREIDMTHGHVLVDFMASSWSGEEFGGTCLYCQHAEKWGAFTIKPNQSESITSALHWLEKRQWKAW
ncbi:MAG: hypothetical protein D3909_13425 [Candidatus Electrothrix sp. ATG1]|nr:hypothetical protein [Candidatus Electrothrix sp. ATG1]